MPRSSTKKRQKLAWRRAGLKGKEATSQWSRRFWVLDKLDQRKCTHHVQGRERSSDGFERVVRSVALQSTFQHALQSKEATRTEQGHGSCCTSLASRLGSKWSYPAFTLHESISTKPVYRFRRPSCQSERDQLFESIPPSPTPTTPFPASASDVTYARCTRFYQIVTLYFNEKKTDVQACYEIAQDGLSTSTTTAAAAPTEASSQRIYSSFYY